MTKKEEQREALQMARFLLRRVVESGTCQTRKFNRPEWARTFAGRCYFVRREMGLKDKVEIGLAGKEVYIFRRQT